MSKDPSAEVKLNDLMFLALDHAIESVRDTGNLLIPFLLTEVEGENRILTRFMDERVEQGIERGKQFLEEQKVNIDRYAFAWDGSLTLEGAKWDAMFVEAGDKIEETGFLVCQRYQKNKGLFKKGITPVGNAALVGKPVSRIRSHTE